MQANFRDSINFSPSLFFFFLFVCFYFSSPNARLHCNSQAAPCAKFSPSVKCEDKWAKWVNSILVCDISSFAHYPIPRSIQLSRERLNRVPALSTTLATQLRRLCFSCAPPPHRRHRATGVRPGEQVGARQPPGSRNSTRKPPTFRSFPHALAPSLLYVADLEAYCPKTSVLHNNIVLCR